MSKKNLLLVLAALVIAAGVYFLMVNKEAVSPTGSPTATPTATPKKSGSATPTETTAKAGTYSCEGGKSFTLSVLADGTARVSGTSSSNNVVLRKSTAGIWVSADSKVAVREVAGYTVLVEGDVVTRDRCTLR